MRKIDILGLGATDNDTLSINDDWMYHPLTGASLAMNSSWSCWPCLGGHASRDWGVPGLFQNVIIPFDKTSIRSCMVYCQDKLFILLNNPSRLIACDVRNSSLGPNGLTLCDNDHSIKILASSIPGDAHLALMHPWLLLLTPTRINVWNIISLAEEESLDLLHPSALSPDILPASDVLRHRVWWADADGGLNILTRADFGVLRQYRLESQDPGAKLSSPAVHPATGECYMTVQRNGHFFVEWAAFNQHQEQLSLVGSVNGPPNTVLTAPIIMANYVGDNRHNVLVGAFPSPGDDQNIELKQVVGATLQPLHTKVDLVLPGQAGWKCPPLRRDFPHYIALRRRQSDQRQITERFVAR